MLCFGCGKEFEFMKKDGWKRLTGMNWVPGFWEEILIPSPTSCEFGHITYLFSHSVFFKNIYLFIWLYQVLVVAPGIFVISCKIFTCSTVLAPRPGIKPTSPALQNGFILPFSIPLLFNWRITALQYSVGFRCTKRWISHKYTYISYLSSLPPTSPTASYPLNLIPPF